jgi:hypothetical protein
MDGFASLEMTERAESIWPETSLEPSSNTLDRSIGFVVIQDCRREKVAAVS